MACKEPKKYFPAVKNVVLPKGFMKGKIALVTGGGTGLGRAIATSFAALGASVAIAARRKDVLEKTASEIREKTGGICEAFQLDVKDPAFVARTLEEIESKLGFPNILVNNAAGNFIMASERLSPNAVKAVMDIVLNGTLNVTMTLGKKAIEKGKGCTVLSITTPYARNGGPFVLPSACAKAGVENMTRSLATEWAKHGWRFNVIAPGPIPTEGAFGRLSNLTMDEATQVIASRVPVGRCGEPEELANLASFICSDAGSWMNGAIIDFDGGQQWFNHGSGMGEQLHEMSSDDWQSIEDKIRNRSGKSKM